MFRFRSNGDDLRRRLSDVGARQLRFATARALTWTAQDAAGAVSDDLAKRLDRPKKFTVNAPGIIPANKTDLTAHVILKGGAKSVTARYLEALDAGGRRDHKPFEKVLIARGIMRASEIAVPSRKVRLDRYGNMSRATIKKLLNGVAASGSAVGSMFVPRGEALPRGIWVRKANRQVEVLVRFVDAGSSYSKMIDFRARAIERAQQSFPRNMVKSFEKAVAGAR